MVYNSCDEDTCLSYIYFHAALHHQLDSTIIMNTIPPSDKMRPVFTACH
jgi:hypothetical protein